MEGGGGMNRVGRSRSNQGLGWGRIRGGGGLKNGQPFNWKGASYAFWFGCYVIFFLLLPENMIDSPGCHLRRVK